MAYPKKWLSAFKAGHRPAARPFIDEEFALQLLERVKRDPNDQEAIEALDYLHKFNGEFHKNVIKKGDTNALHNTDTLRKQLYARENAKNNDIMSKMIYNKVPMQEKYEEMPAAVNTFNYEDTLIDMLDHREEWESFIEHTDKLSDRALAKLVKTNKKGSK